MFFFKPMIGTRQNEDIAVGNIHIADTSIGRNQESAHSLSVSTKPTIVLLVPSGMFRGQSGFPIPGLRRSIGRLSRHLRLDMRS